jgi:hypothetical protein
VRRRFKRPLLYRLSYALNEFTPLISSRKSFSVKQLREQHSRELRPNRDPRLKCFSHNHLRRCSYLLSAQPTPRCTTFRRPAALHFARRRGLRRDVGEPGLYRGLSGAKALQPTIPKSSFEKPPGIVCRRPARAACARRRAPIAVIRERSLSCPANGKRFLRHRPGRWLAAFLARAAHAQIERPQLVTGADRRPGRLVERPGQQRTAAFGDPA